MQLRVVRFVSFRACGLAAAFGILFAGAPAGAQLYWNVGGGAWDTSSPNWSNSPGGLGGTAWSDGNDAHFSGPGGAVSVSGNRTVNDLYFDGSGYTLNNGTITLGTGNIYGNGTGNVTINSTVTGNNGLFMNAAGQVTLSGVNTWNGANGNSNDGASYTVIASGTLAATVETAIPVAGGVNVQGGMLLLSMGGAGLHRQRRGHDGGKPQPGAGP